MKIACLTSGGDAPGMNAVIRAIVRAGNLYGHEIYGIRDGYKGLVEDDMILLTHQSVSGFLSKGGTFLGTSRLPEFTQIKVREFAVRNLRQRGIDALIVIGGDGTYKGGMDLADMGVKVIGIPGTIDNDVAGTDFTIGFNTAVETIVDAIDKLRDTSSSHQRVSIIEVMGRQSGDLAVYAGICGGAEFIITPENQIDTEVMIETIKKYKDEGRRHAIVVVTEKMLDPHELAHEITERSGFSSRATVLGYIQRGGSPCPDDRILGSRMGTYAIELLNDEIHGVCVGVRNNQMVHLEFAQVVNQKRAKSELYDLVKKVS